MSTNIFKRIDTVFVKVKNLEKASEWYETVMGFESTWKDIAGGYVSFAVGETALTLARVPEGEELKVSETPAFNFYASDVQEAHRYLVEKGVNTSEITIDADVKWFSFEDVEGNKLEVCSFL